MGDEGKRVFSEQYVSGEPSQGGLGAEDVEVEVVH